MIGSTDVGEPLYVLGGCAGIVFRAKSFRIDIGEKQMHSGSRNWAYLVGRDGREAAQIIRRETGLSNIQIVGPDMMVTMDYRTDRVRIHVDRHGRVSSPPSIG